MEYINNFRIENFKLFENVEISDISQSINVIIGLNGTGKTTLLQAISVGLSAIDPDFPDYAFSSFFVFNKKYDNKIENKNVRSYFLEPVDIFSKKIGVNNIFFAYSANLFTKENYDHKTPAEKIIQGKQTSHFTDSLFQDYSDIFYDPLRIVDEMFYYEKATEGTKDEKKEWKNVREIFCKTLNEFLDLEEIEKCQIKQVGNRYKFVNQTGAWLLNQLSEGYRANILLIADILMRILSCQKNIFNEKQCEVKNIFNEVQGFILIDEFDRHLHPVWQRKFLSKLKKILPKIQFFVTTHNAFALQSAAGEKLIILENKPVATYVAETIENSTISAIIRKYFTQNIFDVKTQENFDMFNNYLTQIYEKEIEVDFVYSKKFKNLVKKLLDSGNEMQMLISNQLNNLNSALKYLKKEEFVL